MCLALAPSSSSRYPPAVVEDHFGYASPAQMSSRTNDKVRITAMVQKVLQKPKASHHRAWKVCEVFVGLRDAPDLTLTIISSQRAFEDSRAQPPPFPKNLSRCKTCRWNQTSRAWTACYQHGDAKPAETARPARIASRKVIVLSVFGNWP